MFLYVNFLTRIENHCFVEMIIIIEEACNQLIDKSRLIVDDEHRLHFHPTLIALNFETSTNETLDEKV